MIESGFVILIGLVGGIAVGSGYVAFLAVLGIIPPFSPINEKWKAYSIF